MSPVAVMTGRNIQTGFLEPGDGVVGVVGVDEDPAEIERHAGVTGILSRRRFQAARTGPYRPLSKA